MAAYYRVPASLDGRRSKTHGYELIAGELLTKKQCEKEGINPDRLEQVKLGPKKTYWFFGARFEIK